MKFKSILCAALSVLAFAGCQNEQESKVLTPAISLSETEVSVTGLGDSRTIKVTANCSWTAESDATWAHVAPSYGTASTTDMSLLIDANETGVSRTATISVKGVDGLASASIAITESGELLPAGSVIKDADTFTTFLANASSSTDADEFVVTADVDMAGATISPATAFAGKFNGQNHKIYNFKVVSNQSTAGVFLTNDGTISDIVFGSKDGQSWDNTSSISFDDANVSAGSAAALVAMNAGTFENVINFASVKMNVASPSDDYAAVAGIAGKTSGACTLDGCENHGSIEFTGILAYKSVMGGVLGFCKDAGSTVINCRNYGDVAKNSKIEKEFAIGGVVGRSDVNMEVTNCTNEGAVSYNNNDAPASYLHIAGVIGAMYNGCVVSGCANKGSVTSSILQVNRIGGICGTMNTGGTIEKCTNDGEVKIAQTAANANWQAAGGILGFQEKGADNIVRDNTNNGAVIVEVENATTHKNKVNAGGIVGLTALAMEISGNTNNGDVTITNKAAGQANAAGIVGWIYGATSSTSNNVNKGTVTCSTDGNAAAYAGGIIAVNSIAGTTCTEDKNEGAIVCANAAGTGSIAGTNAGTLSKCTAGGSVAGVKLDDSNFMKLAVGTNTGKIEDLLSPSGSSATTTELSLAKTETSVKAEDTSASFDVTSNAAWTVATDASWITSYTKSGENNGTVTIAFAANTSTTDERTAVFTVSASGADPVKFTLTQGKVLDSAPHCIPNAEELALFAKATQEVEKDFSRWQDASGVIALSADIDASSLTCFPIDTIPAGITFDGGNHTVKLAIEQDGEYVSMFKIVKGTVKNVKTSGSVKNTYTGSSEYRTASLVSILDGGLVENCTNSAEIIAAGAPTATNVYSDIAGVVCVFKGDGVAVKNCTNNGKITLNSASCAILGGVAGYGQTNSSAPTLTLDTCVNNGEIVVDHAGGNWDYIGGVIGKMGASSNPFTMFYVQNCSNTAKITITKAPKIRGGGVFGSCGVSTDYLVSGCTFSGDIEVESTETVDRIFAGVGPGFSEAAASGTIKNCTSSGRINAVDGGNFYVAGIYGNNGAATVVIDGCKTTKTSVINGGSAPKSVGVIAARPNKAGFTVKNCKVAGTVTNAEGTLTITSENVADWMFKGSATTVDVTLENNGYNAE